MQLSHRPCSIQCASITAYIGACEVECEYDFNLGDEDREIVFRSVYCDEHGDILEKLNSKVLEKIKLDCFAELQNYFRYGN